MREKRNLRGRLRNRRKPDHCSAPVLNSEGGSKHRRREERTTHPLFFFLGKMFIFTDILPSIEIRVSLSSPPLRCSCTPTSRSTAKGATGPRTTGAPSPPPSCRCSHLTPNGSLPRHCAAQPIQLHMVSKESDCDVVSGNPNHFVNVYSYFDFLFF